MKATYKFLLLLVFCKISTQGYTKDIESIFKNATVQSDYSSQVTLRVTDNATDVAVTKWIHEHKAFFYSTDSITIKTTTLWYYGTTRNMVTYIFFITAENGPKRKARFDEIKRKKDEALQAETKKREDALRAESERMASIKTKIENGSFTGKHYYVYPEGKYDGEFVNGKREGYGYQALSNGEWYEGYFKNDVFHGKGTYRQGNGVRYYGEFVNGKRHGVFIAKRWNIFESNQWEAKYDQGKLVWEHFPESMKPQESCDNLYAKAYTGMERSMIKFGEFEDYYGQLRQSVIFPDGLTSGYLFLDRSTSTYYLWDGTTTVYYKDYESTIRALFIYKNCGGFPVIGKKY